MNFLARSCWAADTLAEIENPWPPRLANRRLAVPRHCEEPDLVAHLPGEVGEEREVVHEHRGGVVDEGLQRLPVPELAAAGRRVLEEGLEEVQGLDRIRRVERLPDLEGLRVAPGAAEGVQDLLESHHDVVVTAPGDQNVAIALLLGSGEELGDGLEVVPGLAEPRAPSCTSS